MSWRWQLTGRPLVVACPSSSAGRWATRISTVDSWRAQREEDRDQRSCRRVPTRARVGVEALPPTPGWAAAFAGTGELAPTLATARPEPDAELREPVVAGPAGDGGSN